jgi:glyoxylase-like metal-dependent hydrolase (beta-lactamase superfamily II)
MLVLFAASVVAGQDGTGALDAAEKAMGTSGLSSLRYEGGGSLSLIGAARTPGGPWLHHTLKRVVTDVHYTHPSMRQAWELGPGRDGPPFGGAEQIWLVAGNDAWDVRGSPPRPELPLFEPFVGSRLAEWRNLEIWLTPPGFIKAAKAHKATVRRQGASSVVSFTTPDRRTFTGRLNAQNLVERIDTALANAVMGDMSIAVIFSDYQQFGDVKFPTRITHIVGGHPTIEMTVTGVKPNGAEPVGPMPSIPPGPPCVGCARGNVAFKSEKLGDGALYLDAGDNFASVVVEFKDYVVVFDAPHDDDRSAPVIAETHRLVPNKPIRYVINSHWHFDHLGGARTFAAEGATVIVSEAARSSVEKDLNAPRTLRPDRFARSGRQTVRVEGVQDKRVLTDGSQTLELHVLMLDHANPTLFAYLPKDKVLVSADVQVQPRPGAAPPREPVPDSLELYTQLVAKKLDVEQFAGIHWGRSTWKDLLTMVVK